MVTLKKKDTFQIGARCMLSLKCPPVSLLIMHKCIYFIFVNRWRLLDKWQVKAVHPGVLTLK